MNAPSTAEVRRARAEADAAVDRWAAGQPWWRRPRRMRRQLATSLAAIALVSVLLVGGLNFFAARNLLQQGTRDQLSRIAESRVQSIETAASRTLARVSAQSADLAVGVALGEFTSAFAELDEAELSAGDEDELRAFYETEIVEPLRAVEVERTVDQLLPQEHAGRYLQSEYVVGADGDPAEVVDPGDGSSYSAIHAAYHEYFRDLADILNLADIKLIDVDGNVVYSVAKQVDFGTDLVNGPYRESNLAESLRVRLPRARTGDAVISDFELYLPNGGRPTAFATATVRSGSEQLGAFVAEIPIAALNAITTANGRWEDLGLGDGETYLVGDDSTLRSESRLWIEDPDGYLAGVDDDLLARRIQFLDSPVGLQPADTEAVRAAVDGVVFEGTTENYLGQQVYSYARLIDVVGVSWVVVADVPHDDAQSPLYEYLWEVGLVLLVLLPIAALIGVAIAKRVTEPIPQILDAAERVVRGDRDPGVPDFGRNEFGDLARRLRRTALQLGEQEAALERQYDETRAVLLSALPPRAVRDGLEPTSDADMNDVGTAIAVAVEFRGEQVQINEALGDLYAAASRTAERLAADRGIERVRAAADRYLFVAGLGDPSDGADVALDLAATFARRATAFAEREEVAVRPRIGLATGRIETGLMTEGSLSYTAWGNAVRTAMVIGSLGTATVGAHSSTVEAADAGRWTFGESPGVVGLDDETMHVFSLTLDDTEPDHPEFGQDDGKAGAASGNPDVEWQTAEDGETH